MTTRKVEEVDRFAVVDDDGNEHEAVCYQTFTSFADVSSGGVKWLKGAKDYKLSDGTELSGNSDGTFTDLDTDKKLRRM